MKPPEVKAPSPLCPLLPNSQTSPSHPHLPGFRPYMTGLAQFMTRVREAEWVGGEPPYVYAMNNPPPSIDPRGLPPGAGDCLTPHECGSGPGGPCRYAEHKRLVKKNQYGGLVCCDGVMHACVYNTKKDWPIGIYNCIKKHERDHIVFREEKGGLGCHEHGFYVPPLPKQFIKESECRANILSLKCLIEGQKSDCSKFTGAKYKKCFDDYCIVIKSACWNVKFEYDCGVALPKECGVCDWGFLW